jgi:hypothetical protein
MPRVLRRFLAPGMVLALAIGTAIMAAHPGGGRAMIGTLQQVQGRTLTVLTAGGPETLMLSPSATVRVGTRIVSLSELASRTGTRVKVRYTESGGQKHARSITVAAVKKETQTT